MPNFQDNEPLTTAAEVKQLHYKDDVDSGELAHHHTLGTRKNQAASGDRGFLTGDLKISARDTVPDGWLNCDGAAVNRTTYQALFMAIGTTYGVGDGSTTFNVPDMRDRFPVGSSGTKAVGSTGGSTSMAHTHPITNQAGHTHTLTLSDPNMPTAANTTTGGTAVRLTGGASHVHAGSTADSGGSHDHTGNTGAASNTSTQNPYLGLKFLIKT